MKHFPLYMEGGTYRRKPKPVDVYFALSSTCYATRPKTNILRITPLLAGECRDLAGMDMATSWS